MDRNDCIKHCRYYTGSAENTFSDNESFFWFWEKKWVEFSEVAYSSNRDSEPLHIMINEYIDAGLISFEQMDDTPVTLKALLFNRFCHHTDLSLIDGAEAFKIFYVSEYTKSPINLINNYLYGYPPTYGYGNGFCATMSKSIYHVPFDFSTFVILNVVPRCSSISLSDPKVCCLIIPSQLRPGHCQNLRMAHNTSFLFLLARKY